MKQLDSPPNPALKEQVILFGFAVTRKGTDGSLQVSIRWGRLFLSLIGLVAVMWLSAAGALYFWFKNNKDFDAVRYSGMLTLPFRLDEHRREMGDYHVEKGLRLTKEGNYRDALRLLRLGVTRSPGNLEGRKVLAEFYEYALKRHDVAIDIMMVGLSEGQGADDIDYLKRTLALLLKYQLDDKVQDVANEYLPAEVEINERNRLLAFAAAQASTLRGNFDRASDFIRNYELLEALDGLLLSAQISWERGNKLAAISKLEVSLNKFSGAEGLLVTLSRYNRELGRIDAARRYATLRNVAAPLSPAPRIELLYIYNLSGDTEREATEIKRMLRQFRSDQDALRALANFAADTGNIELARRTYEAALEGEFQLDGFALLLIEAHIVATDHDGALRFAEELLNERPDWLEIHWPIFSSLRAIASYGLNRPDLGDIYLQDFLGGEKIQPNQYLAIARRFSKMEAFQLAQKILVAAYEKAPNNQKVLSDLIRVELTLGHSENLNQLLKKFLKMRRPEIDLITQAYQTLGSDRFIFTPNRENLIIELNAELRERATVITDLQS